MQYRIIAIAVWASTLSLAQSVSQQPPATCPVTKPPEQAFVPPAAFALSPDPERFFFGSEKLWTYVPLSGVYPTVKQPDGYGSKQAWFSSNHEIHDFEQWRTGPKPSIKITVRRLDGDTLPPPESNGSFSFGSRNAFFMSGPTVPTPGCWEITGTIDEAKLSFVVWVVD